MVAILAVAVGISIPIRAAQERGESNLEHRGIGLSNWHDEIEGTRYRRAKAVSSVFIPSDTSAVTIPLRVIQPAEELRVELWLDGRPADVVRVRANAWLNLQLLIPPRSGAPRFRRLEFRVTDGSLGDRDVLMIGKVQPR
jgi:hypothetical protein